MKKIYLFTLVFLAFVCTAQAQIREPVNPENDKLQYEGYTIRLLQAMGNTYGYDIFEGERLVVHQDMNPFTMAPTCLYQKEDAYKVAKWLIEQLKKENSGLQINPPLPGGPMPMGRGEARINQPLPRKIAEELQIKL